MGADGGINENIQGQRNVPERFNMNFTDDVCSNLLTHFWGTIEYKL